jgi:YHS domain-containing protein
MFSAYLKSAVAGAFLLGFATAALAVTGEFDNMCTQGLATGQDIKTDCSINAQLEGKTYCFGSKDAMAEFMKNPKENLAKAQTYYSKKHPG